MSSTNKTTNLKLSQFLGSDHFAFLTDYNGDMLKIDQYCGNLKALIDGNSGEVESLKNFKTSQEQTNAETNQKISNNIDNINATNLKVNRNSESVASLESKVKTLESTTDKDISYEIELSNVVLEGFPKGTKPRVYYKPSLRMFRVYAWNTTSSLNLLNTTKGLSFRAEIDVSSLSKKDVDALKFRSISGLAGLTLLRENLMIDGVEYEFTKTGVLTYEIMYDEGDTEKIYLSIKSQGGGDAKTETGGVSGYLDFCAFVR